MIDVFVDMDGVIADFDDAKRRCELDDLTDDKMWEVIDKTYPNWFIQLKPMPGWKDLWNAARELDRNCDPIILSAMSKKRSDRVWQKQYWLFKMFQDTPPASIICLRSHKQDWSGPNRLLIDDSEETISEWIKKGGIGIHFKNAKQAIEEMRLVKELYAPSNSVGHAPTGA